MDLAGAWQAAPADDELRRSFPQPSFDDSGWERVTVPGHWQDVAAFSSSHGPLLYRRAFSHPTLEAHQRAWLVLDGVFYQSYVWLDGSYLGDTEGYFFPHAFEVTQQARVRSEHLVGLEVSCAPPADRTAKTALTGVFGDWDCIDPSFNPGGVWAPAHIDVTGPVRIASLFATCTEASTERAVLDLEAVLDSSQASPASVSVELVGPDGQVAALLRQAQPVAVGANRARWALEVPSPRLWWPRALGAQELYRLTVTASVGGDHSDSRSLLTGLRTVKMRDFVWRVNGERLFLKGANLAPTRRSLALATPAEVGRDVELAAGAGLDLLRVHGHIGRSEVYDTADRLGVLLWQDMPLQWRYGNVRAEAVRQATAAVELLGHHPSIALWCGHNEPFVVDPPRGTGAKVKAFSRFLAGQALPNRDKSFLDRSIRGALQRADRSRPVLSHSGLFPHPAWGTDSHLYFGWYHGQFDDLPRGLRAWPATARFVGELGAQAVPTSAAFMAPSRWPDLDWAELEEHFCFQKAIFDRFVPPAGYADFDAWQVASQAYQAKVVKFQVEALRKLKYRPTGGFAVFLLNDAQPAVSWSLLDHERLPKQAWQTLVRACAPVLVAADWPRPVYRPGQRLDVDVHVVNDLRHALVGASLEARLSWPGGGRRWQLEGEAPADSCLFAGHLSASLPHLPGPGPWPLQLDLALSWPGGEGAMNNYESSLSAYETLK